MLQDANSIGTTYLRASLLPEAHKIPVEATLVRYVDARLAFYQSSTDWELLASAESQTAALQLELWAHAVAASKEAPTPIAKALAGAMRDSRISTAPEAASA